MKTKVERKGWKQTVRAGYVVVWVLTVCAAIDLASAWHNGDVRNSRVATAIDSAVQPRVEAVLDYIAELDGKVNTVLADVEQTYVRP